MSKKLAIVMAGGKGTRMKSELPKVLIEVCGRPMIEYVLDALDAAGVDQTVVVVGYRAADVEATLAGRPHVSFALQAEQLGTGHAVMMCRRQIEAHEGPVLVVAGDSPMMQPSSLQELFAEYDRSHSACILGTCNKDDPSGLGRIVRDAQGNFARIAEDKDATPEERKIREVNLSCYIFDARELAWALDRISSDNAQREYYVTDCPGVLNRAGKDVRALPVLKPIEALSINNAEELAAVEAAMRARA